MKTFFLSVTLFFVIVNSVQSNSSEEIMENVKAKYLELLKNRGDFENITAKMEKICPGSGSKIELALNEVKQCADEIEEETETACSSIKNHLMRCAQPIITMMEECLPAKSKDIPKFVFKSVVSGVNYLCKTDGEHIFELANSCVYRYSAASAKCERKIKTKAQEYKKKTPAKADICEFGYSIKPCIEQHMLSTCQNQITREAFIGLVNAFLVPCGINANGISDGSNAEVEIFHSTP